MSNLKKEYSKFISQQETTNERFYDSSIQLDKFYIPLSEKIFKLHKLKNRPLILGD